MSYFSILNHLLKESTELLKHILGLFLQSKNLITSILFHHMIFVKHLVNAQGQIPIFIDNS